MLRTSLLLLSLSCFCTLSASEETEPAMESVKFYPIPSTHDYTELVACKTDATDEINATELTGLWVTHDIVIRIPETMVDLHLFEDLCGNYDDKNPLFNDCTDLEEPTEAFLIEVKNLIAYLMTGEMTNSRSRLRINTIETLKRNYNRAINRRSQARH